MGTKRRPKARANGTGTAYQRNKTWTAAVVVDWKTSEDGTHKIPVYATKGGFKKRSDALNYCPTLLKLAMMKHGVNPPEELHPTLEKVYQEWEPKYSPRIVPSTMACYYSAYKHFEPLHSVRMDNISARDLQDCMDACTLGKRTHQNMKVIAGLLWKYAFDSKYVEANVAENLYIGKHQTIQRDPLTEDEVETIRNAIGKIRYAEYVYAACYLGFRPTELLSLKKEHYRMISGYDCLVNGFKTDAGKDRVVIIPPQILDLIRDRLFVPGTDLIFPMYKFKRSKKETFSGFGEMREAYFREYVFKPMMQKLGIAEGKTPYAARHTYSDKLKRAQGGDKTKAGLMGHTDYAFTQSHYQSIDLDDLLEVASTLE